ncbi:hypothetical protein GCM10010104_59920 [Streptomyces indiaensis]|uniref:Uncharacterized protein n=1 Tax=Streptomyces indiaensis TaxID=284033 RepID=A0ABN3EDA3_9ACTN
MDEGVRTEAGQQAAGGEAPYLFVPALLLRVVPEADDACHGRAGRGESAGLGAYGRCDLVRDRGLQAAGVAAEGQVHVDGAATERGLLLEALDEFVDVLRRPGRSPPPRHRRRRSR